MPMKSKAQRAYLWENQPEVAAQFEAETPNGKKLPARANEKKSLLASAVPVQRVRDGELRLKRRPVEDTKFYGHGSATREACMSIDEVSSMITEIDHQMHDYRNGPSTVRPGREAPTRWGAPANPSAGPVGNGPTGVSNLGYPA